MFFRIISIIVFIGSLSACSYFTSPKDNPLIVYTFKADAADKANFSISATDANRRVAILDVINGQVCVEPPPEAANAISEAFTALFKADVKDKGGLGASLSKSVAQNVSQLFRRTQTVQLYRDAVFALCQSSINGSIEINSTTTASATEKESKTVVSEIKKLANFSDYKEQINNLTTIKTYDIKAIEALNLRLKAESTLDVERKKIETLRDRLFTKIKKKEFNERLADGLNNAYATLKVELPQFYQTEKIRFLAEMSKPIQVCTTTTHSPEKNNKKDTENEPESDSENEEESVNEKEHMGTTVKECHAELPKDFDKVIAEYVKALGMSEVSGGGKK